ncbi:GNAT family N-acetyltransferase [Burkholderia ubonensis]|uniref:GNAT family N-acetyltransferase n=1 Tax=Burkholderia ubonensis TaxID=101571 RepID=UPI0009B4CFBE|nr:GNAT family N-acetyltransferase [Burkholderia ubonensis]
MVDPTKSLQSFQQALLAGTVRIQRCELDEKLVVHLDNPDGAPRFTYARLQGQTVAALVMLVLVEPIGGLPCFQLGYAVDEAYRNQGLATEAVVSSIAELKNGLGRSGGTDFCIEAVVGADNKASQRVVEKVGFPSPKEIVDEFSGEPALQYFLTVKMQLPRTQ